MSRVVCFPAPRHRAAPRPYGSPFGSWCTADRKIVLLTVFRKTRQHDRRQIDRAVRVQKACERDHRGPAAETYERQV